MTSISRKPTARSRPSAGRRPRSVRPRDGQHRRLGVDAECVPDVVSPDHGGARASDGFLKIRDRCRKAHELHRRVWDAPPCRHCGGVSMADQPVSAVVCKANLHTAAVHEMLDEAVEQDGVLRGGLFPSGMPLHQQRGGRSYEPAVPTDVCKPGPARPSRLVRVTVKGLGLAVELCSHAPRRNRPRTHDRTASSLTVTLS